MKIQDQKVRIMFTVVFFNYDGLISESIYAYYGLVWEMRLG